MSSPHGNSRDRRNNFQVKRSYSTPCEDTVQDVIIIDKRKTPPITPNKNNSIVNNNGSGGGGAGGKMVAIKILLLDDSVTIIQAQTKALGRLVFDQICKQLNVLEADYFGLEYHDDAGVTYWLDLEKRLTRQVGLTLSEPLLKFSVKFYTPDPSQLEEEFTRYLFSLQIKRDLANGTLTCNDNTAALMASFIVQAECGDFSEEDYPDASYLSVYKFVPHQNYELERKIRESHKKHIGQSPAEADLHLLETARRTELYGIKTHPAKDEDSVNLNLSVCHMGVLVFQNNTKINTFSWAKIRKISFKRKRFILKLHPEGYYKELVEFIFDSRNECKSYWKRCVEHHAFFRCEKAPNPIHRSKGILSSRGSSFRYSGRTQKQMVAFVRENFIKRPPTSTPSQSQYHSQQNLSSFGQQQQQQQQITQAQFQRSSSFKQPQPSGSAPQNRFFEAGQVTASRSSPAMMNNERNNYNDDDDEEEDEEEEEFSDYVVDKQKHTPTGQAPHSKSLPSHHHQQAQQQDSLTSSPLRPDDLEEDLEASTPDYFYYKMKETLTYFRTYRKDLSHLSHILPPPVLQKLLPVNTLSKSFALNMEELKKEHWESRHGQEILYKLAKHFESNVENYASYFEYLKENYDALIEKDTTNFYQGKCCLLLKPLEWVKYCWKRVDKVKSLLTPLVEKMGNAKLHLLCRSKIFELSRDLVGFKNEFVTKQGRFLRQGILLKLNKRKGLQNRIFFLFTDVLAYGTRISSAQGFRIHGIIQASQMELNESSSSEVSGIPNSFVVNVINNVETTSGESNVKILVLAAFNDKDKREWTESIKYAIVESTSRKDFNGGNLTNYNSSEEFLKPELIETAVANQLVQQHRLNATTHVCWHRNLSVSAEFLVAAYEHTISGYLLRKFKNSPGWQRLWVVYSNICLYFYKSHDSPVIAGNNNTNNNQEEDALPLASLPLLGYSVDVPSPQDNITKDHVFKLSFKNHVYFFRAESPYTFQKWMRTIKQSTCAN